MAVLPSLKVEGGGLQLTVALCCLQFLVGTNGAKQKMLGESDPHSAETWYTRGNVEPQQARRHGGTCCAFLCVYVVGEGHRLN